MKLGYQTNTWGGVVGHPVGVTSIKDLFYLANGSTEDAIRDIAAAGYAGIELFDGNVVAYADRPDELRALLADTGLDLIGAYSGANFIFDEVLGEELWRIERTAALAGVLGAEHLVVGGGAQRVQPPTDDDYRRLAAGLDEVVGIAERHGLIASYHPHLTTIVERPDQVDRVMARTSIDLCPDTGHVILGGGDPAQLIRTHGHRIRYVHLKDVTTDGEFVPLGQGVLDVEGVLEALREIGFDGWLTVELDAWPDPAEGAAKSLERLRSLLPV